MTRKPPAASDAPGSYAAMRMRAIEPWRTPPGFLQSSAAMDAGKQSDAGRIPMRSMRLGRVCLHRTKPAAASERGGP